MNDILTRYGWVWRLLTVTAVIVTSYTQLNSSLTALAERVNKVEVGLIAANSDRSEVLVMLGRLEERLKAVQAQLDKK